MIQGINPTIYYPNLTPSGRNDKKNGPPKFNNQGLVGSNKKELEGMPDNLSWHKGNLSDDILKAFSLRNNHVVCMTEDCHPCSINQNDIIPDTDQINIKKSQGP